MYIYELVCALIFVHMSNFQSIMLKIGKWLDIYKTLDEWPESSEGLFAFNKKNYFSTTLKFANSPG